MLMIPSSDQIYRWFIHSSQTIGEISTRSGLSIDQLWDILGDEGETLAAMPLPVRIRLAITVGQKKLIGGTWPGETSGV